MIQTKLSLLLLLSITLTACAQSTTVDGTEQTPTTKNSLSTEQKQQLQQLIEKTKKNLIFVKGGSYMMGDFGPEQSPEHMAYDGNGDSKPLHKVTLDDFSLGATKATYADFDVYTSVTGQKPVGNFEGKKIRYRIPTIAAGINWQQARSYCQWLGKQIHRNMDLPTEAQWEYAARNRGQYVLYATDNGKIDIGRNVWSFEQRETSQEKFRVYKNVAELQQFPPNPLGLYDMVMDNREWMLDWYDADYYSKSPEHNPQGPTTGTLKVTRSSILDDGQNITMIGKGLTMQRRSMHPIADPEKVKWASTVDFAVDLNENNTVRCAANP